MNRDRESRADRLLALPFVLRLTLAAACVLLSAMLVGVYANRRVEHELKPQLRAVLSATLDSGAESVQAWVRGAERTATAATQDSRLIGLVHGCIEQSPCDLRMLAQGFAPYAQMAGFTQLWLVSAEGEVRAAVALGAGAAGGGLPLRAAARDHAVGLAAAPAGVLPPIDARDGLLLVRAPLPRGKDSPSATLVLGLPFTKLSELLRPLRPGRSGETYAFDHEGRMLSESRFIAAIRGLPVFEPAEAGSSPIVALRDPGLDLTLGRRGTRPRSAQPLTRMAALATAGQDGVLLERYRDYRGVDVVGAYRWLDDLSLGLTTEIDAHDAFRTLEALKGIFTGLVSALAAAVSALLIALGFSVEQSMRTRRAEKLAARYGQYRVVRKIGQGGMGSVYLATHALLRRPAAIKVIRPDRIEPGAHADFEREVQITSTLNHPNTVEVYDYGRSEDGTFYYVMEYLEGLDLQCMVERFGPLPEARVVHLMRQLCGSLSEAHAAGLAHRDIKPSNLLCCTRGGIRDTLKVLDFGLALARNPLSLDRSSFPAGADGAAGDRLSIGTPEYMAPEVFESASQAGPQSDLYAVGAVAYFLLTGAPPFDDATPSQLCLAHLSRDPEPPSAVLGRKIDPMLESIVLSCLAKVREKRPSSALALRALLERSPLVSAWTQADAERWWTEHAEQFEEARSSRVPPAPTSELPRAIRPQELM